MAQACAPSVTKRARWRRAVNCVGAQLMDFPRTVKCKNNRMPLCTTALPCCFNVNLSPCASLQSKKQSEILVQNVNGMLQSITPACFSGVAGMMTHSTTCRKPWPGRCARVAAVAVYEWWSVWKVHHKPWGNAKQVLL